MLLAFGAYFLFQKDKVADVDNYPEQINFQIPENTGAAYISFQDWSIKIIYDENEYPSNLKVVDNKIDCEETQPESSFSSGIDKRVIGDRTYCIERSSEGAAGSVYTTYNYSTIYDGNLLSLGFVARYVQCSNYDDPQKTECIEERETFSLDELVMGIVDKNN